MKYLYLLFGIIFIVSSTIVYGITIIDNGGSDLSSISSDVIDYPFYNVAANGSNPILGGKDFHPYDVIVEVLDKKVEPGSTVNIKITIKNTGVEPNHDAILTYELFNNKVFDEHIENILESPPGYTYYNKKLTLPYNSTIGEWKVRVIYQLEGYPTLVAIDSFEVVKEKGLNITIYYFAILGLLLLLILLLISFRMWKK